MNSEGEHIKILRKSIGMSQREFADHLGISVRTIQDWEVGRRVPPSYVPRLLAYRVEYERVCKSQKVLIAYFANTSAEMLVEYIAEHNKTSKMCFLHVPYSDKISDVDMFHERLEASIRQVIFANI